MKLIFCTGAGLSAESGIDTFRSKGGLWDIYDPEKVCNMDVFLDNYIDTNDFYDIRRQQLKRIIPNSAHEAIGKLCGQFEVVSFTTNVDDLLERSGSKDVKHIHGKITEVVTQHGTPQAEVIEIGYNKSPYEDLKLYPVKPNVTFFGECSDQYQRFEEYIKTTSSEDIAFVIGSSEQIFPFTINMRYGFDFAGKIIFVNPDKTLCEMMSETTNVEIYNMTATEFFKTYNFNKHKTGKNFSM